MYRRPVLTVSSFGKGDARFILKSDLHNRRVTISWLRGVRDTWREKVYTFSTRDEAREFVETVLDRREKLGYVPLDFTPQRYAA